MHNRKRNARKPGIGARNGQKGEAEQTGTNPEAVNHQLAADLNGSILMNHTIGCIQFIA